VWLIATYDRWVEKLVAAGRLPGEIAEEIEWRAKHWGLRPSEDIQLGGCDFAHEPWRAPFC
jgi:hypothetical protein